MGLASNHLEENFAALVTAISVRVLMVAMRQLGASTRSQLRLLVSGEDEGRHLVEAAVVAVIGLQVSQEVFAVVAKNV